MGYDINIVGICECRRNVSNCKFVCHPDDEIADRSCLGFSFAYYHFIPIWNIPEHMHNKKGSEVASHILRALKDLEKNGVDISRPDKGSEITFERFAYRLRKFLCYATHCINATFICDSCEEDEEDFKQKNFGDHVSRHQMAVLSLQRVTDDCLSLQPLVSTKLTCVDSKNEQPLASTKMSYADVLKKNL